MKMIQLLSHPFLVRLELMWMLLRSLQRQANRLSAHMLMRVMLELKITPIKALHPDRDTMRAIQASTTLD
jgi:hypothetical protein